MAEYDLPIWMHPARTSDMTDYAAEEKSRYEIWWALGWPYETSAAMVRLVLWELFDRYPNIKILTHHLGGMIPYFEEQVGAGLSVLGARTRRRTIPGNCRPSNALMLNTSRCSTATRQCSVRLRRSLRGRLFRRRSCAFYRRAVRPGGGDVRVAETDGTGSQRAGEDLQTECRTPDEPVFRLNDCYVRVLLRGRSDGTHIWKRQAVAAPCW